MPSENMDSGDSVGGMENLPPAGEAEMNATEINIDAASGQPNQEQGDKDNNSGESGKPKTLDMNKKFQIKHGKPGIKPSTEGVVSFPEDDEDANEKILNDKDKEIKEGKDDSIDKSKQGKPSRDYSIFKPEDAEFLKATPNQVFDYLKTRLPALYDNEKKSAEYQEQLAKLKEGRLPDSYYEHPNAYMLTPEFEQLSLKSDRVNFEQQHWMEQLERIESGQPFVELKGYNKQGQPVYSEPREAQSRDKVFAQQTLMAVQQAAMDIDNKLGSLQQGFGSRHQQDLNLIKEESKKRFPWLSDEKKLQDEITLDDGKKASVKSIIEKAKSVLPASVRNHPLSDVFGNMYAATLMINQEGKKKDQLIAQLQQQLKDRNSGEPSSEARSSQISEPTATRNGNGKLKYSAVPKLDDMEE